MCGVFVVYFLIGSGEFGMWAGMGKRGWGTWQWACGKGNWAVGIGDWAYRMWAFGSRKRGIRHARMSKKKKKDKGQTYYLFPLSFFINI
jgi:hypothetical protein